VWTLALRVELGAARRWLARRAGYVRWCGCESTALAPGSLINERTLPCPAVSTWPAPGEGVPTAPSAQATQAGGDAAQIDR
jgi:hypothetical protein